MDTDIQETPTRFTLSPENFQMILSLVSKRQGELRHLGIHNTRARRRAADEIAEKYINPPTLTGVELEQWLGKLMSQSHWSREEKSMISNREKFNKAANKILPIPFEIDGKTRKLSDEELEQIFYKSSRTVDRVGKLADELSDLQPGEGKVILFDDYNECRKSRYALYNVARKLGWSGYNARQRKGNGKFYLIVKRPSRLIMGRTIPEK